MTTIWSTFLAVGLGKMRVTGFGWMGARINASVGGAGAVAEAPVERAAAAAAAAAVILAALLPAMDTVTIVLVPLMPPLLANVGGEEDGAKTAADVVTIDADAAVVD